MVVASSFGVRGSGFGFRGLGFGLRVSSFEFWIWVLSFWFRVMGFGIRVSGFGCRDSDSGVRVSGFGFWVSGLKFREYLRASRRVSASASSLSVRPVSCDSSCAVSASTCLPSSLQGAANHIVACFDLTKTVKSLGEDEQDIGGRGRRAGAGGLVRGGP